MRKVLCENIAKISPKIYERKNKSAKNSFYVLHLGINDTRRLGKFIYGGSTKIKMERKYIKFIAAGEIKKDIRGRIILLYKDAKEKIKEFNIKTQKEWYIFCKKGLKPFNIPSCPAEVYKNKGWVSWSNFLDKDWISFSEAKKLAIENKIKSLGKWRKFCSSVRKEIRVPTKPFDVYKDKGWASWQDFLDK